MTDFDKPFTELPARQPEHDQTVSGSKLSGYYVIDVKTGERLSGPYDHWFDAFRNAR
jgi:hypothetical protein